MAISNLDVKSLDAQMQTLQELLRVEREETERQNQQLIEFENDSRNIWVERNREFIKALGMNEKELEKQAERDKKYLIEQLESFNQAEQKQFRGRSLQQRVIENAIAPRRPQRARISPAPAQPQISDQLIPPAYGCDGGTEGVNCFPETGELRTHRRVSGQGGAWGWFAHPMIRPEDLGLSFMYIPSFEGSLSVTANVHLQGNAWIIANHPFWTSTVGEIRLDLYCHVFQAGYGLFRGAGVTVINERRSGGVYHRIFDDEAYYPWCFANVVANEPVFIRVGVSIYMSGHSDYGIADVDFLTELPGINNRISIPAIGVTLDPFIIL